MAARALTDEGARPSVYCTLRDATCTRDLLFALVVGCYLTARLGLFGTLCQSMGVYWIVLFDMMLGRPAHTRAVHFSAILSHFRRGLRMHAAASAGDGQGAHSAPARDHP